MQYAQSGPVVTLSPAELISAAQIGIIRQIEAIRRKLPDKHGYVGDGWSLHVEGACGELAFAKALNVYWAGTVNVYKDADVGANIQIRTRSKANYDLLIRSDDSDDEVFVLVTGTAPTFRVVGWILGRDAKQGCWEQTHGNRPPAFFVPQSELRPISELRVIR
jgi:hypothetical protein